MNVRKKNRNQYLYHNYLPGYSQHTAQMSYDRMKRKKQTEKIKKNPKSYELIIELHVKVLTKKLWYTCNSEIDEMRDKSKREKMELGKRKKKTTNQRIRRKSKEKKEKRFCFWRQKPEKAVKRSLKSKRLKRLNSR